MHYMLGEVPKAMTEAEVLTTHPKKEMLERKESRRFVTMNACYTNDTVKIITLQLSNARPFCYSHVKQERKHSQHSKPRNDFASSRCKLRGHVKQGVEPLLVLFSS